MKNLKIVFIILLNVNYESEAGKLQLSDSFQMRLEKTEERIKRGIDHSLAVEVLLRDKISQFSKVTGDKYLSEAIEHMDAPSLLKLLGKLKEEYVAKAEKGDAEKVRNSFDKLTATLVTLSNGTKRSLSGPAQILEQLSEEEELEDESAMYGADFYSEDEYSDEDSSNPSLLELQSWNRKLTSPDGWNW